MSDEKRISDQEDRYLEEEEQAVKRAEEAQQDTEEDRDKAEDAQQESSDSETKAKYERDEARMERERAEKAARDAYDNNVASAAHISEEIRSFRDSSRQRELRDAMRIQGEDFAQKVDGLTDTIKDLRQEIKDKANAPQYPPAYAVEVKEAVAEAVAKFKAEEKVDELTRTVKDLSQEIKDKTKAPQSIGMAPYGVIAPGYASVLQPQTDHWEDKAIFLQRCVRTAVF